MRPWFLSVPSLVTLLVATAIGCGRPSAPPAASAAQRTAVSPPYETVTLVLPQGEIQGGRTAFLDLKCTACHRVEGETEFPAPFSGSQGPDLDRALKLRSPSELATAIIVPSHSMSVKTSDEIKKRLAGELLSPMPDISRTMTVRQLVDLVAYLQSLPNGR